MNSAYILIDLQFGSTGKGLLSGYLAETLCPDVVVSNFGPNSGHTYIDSKNRKFVFKMLPMGCLSPKLFRVLLGPGSVINIPVLMKEIREVRVKTGIDLAGRIIVHPNATIWSQMDADNEVVLNRIGSTQQGTMAALIRKLERNNEKLSIASQLFEMESVGSGTSINYEDGTFLINEQEYDACLRASQILQIESSQGYSLSIDSRFWPYCTSRNITPPAIMDQCAIPWSFRSNIKVYGSMRTLPIRVGNRYDEKGEMVGWSGPGYKDQVEIDWSDIGLEPEKTTVTNIPRRLFTFSNEQLRKSINMCDPQFIFLNFCNYMMKDGELTGELKHIIDTIRKHRPISHFGVGPTYYDVIPHHKFPG